MIRSLLMFCVSVLWVAASPLARAGDAIVVEQTANFTQRTGVLLSLGYNYTVHNSLEWANQRWIIAESDVTFSASIGFGTRGTPTPNGQNVPFRDTSYGYTDFLASTATWCGISTTTLAVFGVFENDPPVRVQYSRRLTLYRRGSNGLPEGAPLDHVDVRYDLTLRYTPGVPGVSGYPKIKNTYINFYVPGYAPEERPGVAPTNPPLPICPTVGSKTASTESAAYQISLGRAHYGKSGEGAILFKAKRPESSMYTPAYLGLPIGDSDSFRRIKGTATNPNLIQYSAPASVFTIHDPVTTDQTYQILGYHSNQATLAADGSYSFTGDPFITFTVENPDASGSTINRIRFTRSFAGRNEVDSFTYDAATATWSLDSPESGLKESIAEASQRGVTNLTETKTIVTSDNLPVSSVRTTLAQYSFGTVPIEEVRDPTGKAVTTRWEYYASAPTGVGEVKTVRSPYQGWITYTYGNAPENTGVPERIKAVRQFLDAPESAPESALRVRTKTYISGTLSPLSYRDSESLLGQEIRRVFKIIRPSEGYDEVVALAPGVDWTNSAQTQTTKYRFIFGGSFDREPSSITYPDGTRVNFRYEIDPTTSVKTTVREQGVPDLANPSLIVDGIRTTTLTNVAGEVLASTTVDIASGLTVASQLATQVDAFGRPTHRQTLRGIESQSFGCCGLESSTDFSGLTTTYTENGSTRTETSQGVTLTTAQSGGVTTIHRQGSAGPQSRILLREQNLAGQPTRSLDAANRETTYDETIDPVTAYRTRLTTRPDGGTITEIYFPDGQLQSVSGTATAPRRYEYGVENNHRYTKEFRLGDNGEESDWTQTFTDMAGRIAKVVRSHESGTPGVSTNEYNGKGQLFRTIDPDGVALLFGYNALGEQVTTAIDLNRNGAIDRDGTDQITETESSWSTRAGQTVRKTVERIYQANGSPNPTELRITEEAVNGLENWVTTAGLTTHSRTVLSGNGNATTTVTFPDGTQTVTGIVGGRIATVTRLNIEGGQVSRTESTYDALGRVQTSIDARTGATTFAWFDDDQLSSVTAPGPQVTSMTYDSAGRPDTTTLPDGGVIDQDWFPTGLLQRQSGARTYPIDSAYDRQGRLRSLTTASGITRWNYHPASGRLSQKLHGDGYGPAYAYTAAGRLASRISGRGVTTAYGYDNAGSVAEINYSDATPDIRYTRDRQGRIATATSGGSVTTYGYNLAGQPESESITGGTLDGVTIDPGYDALRRRSSFAASGTDWNYQQTYGYDSSGRLASTGFGTHSFSYGYLANANLLETITSNSGLTSVRTWDALDRLQSISTTGASFVQGFAYRHNTANQRDRITREDGARWDFTYDNHGQLNGATQRLPGGDALAGHSFGYAYDAIGNRTAATFGLTGNRTMSYGAATGDGTQYSSISHPGFALVTGEADPAAAVTIDAASPASRQSNRFAHEITIDNQAGPATKPVVIAATLGSVTETETRQAFVPAAVVTPEYDLDGNLTFDGFLEYTWDAENRLTTVKTRNGRAPPGSTLRDFRETLAYDHANRLIRRKSWQTLVGQEYPATDDLYVYDGWNQIAVLDADTKRPRQTYTWGLDLSGTLQGAGGVGGLLQITDAATGTTHFPAYDGNGNVTALIDPTTGATTARYEYDPFGNVLAATGSFAAQNPWRFSTKQQDRWTGQYYYGYRHYDATAGRWLSRDPLGEAGGANLYGFLGNDGVGTVDPLGLSPEALALNGASSYLSAFEVAAIAELQAWSTAAAQVAPPLAIASTGYQLYRAEKASFNLWEGNVAREACRNSSCYNSSQMFSLAINALSIAAGQAADAASRNDLDMAATAMNSLASALDVMDLAAQFLEEHCPDTSFDFQRLHSQAKQAATKARAVRLLAEGERLGGGVTEPASEFVVSFMGKNGIAYYDNAAATLGPSGGLVWTAPIEDVTSVTTRSGIVTATGHAPGPLASYLAGDAIYGIAVPRRSLNLRLPGATDAGANRHFRLGGLTGVEHRGKWKSSGVREFILDGGAPVPTGSVFFRVNNNGSWTPIRHF